MGTTISTTPAVAHSTLTKGGSLTVVRVGRKCSVSYEFDTSATNRDLALRYRVIIDGKLMPTEADSPRVLDAKGRKIKFLVDPGSRVALFLNSDVHPDFRRHPVYAVTVGENDVQIKITERKGRKNHKFAVLNDPYRQKDPTTGKLVDKYNAELTGDIWMDISNLYTEDEADAMLPEDTDAAVRDAVRRIYRGLPSNELVVTFPASETALKLTLRVRFDEPDNVLENTCYCPLLTSVLPRTHPCAYAALLTEAHAAQVTALRVTSGWRPMLGSIAHRAGLGLDINYAESATKSVKINRASLTNAKLKRNDNVSEREQVLYAEYQQAKNAAAARGEEFVRAKKTVEVNRDPKESARFQALLDIGKSKKDDADKIKAVAAKAWNGERDRNEHSLIRTLRSKLDHNKSIKQVLDPWYMNTNTQGGTPAVPNEHRSANEKTHNNHLHITITDPKIL